MSSTHFNSLELCPDDPILQLMVVARNDPNPAKVDLSAGIYKNDAGLTPVMDCVKTAEQRRVDTEQSKSYLGLAGDLRFNEQIARLALGDKHPAIADGRVATIQTTGGSGAIRVAAELLKRIKRGSQVWVSDPTWANHIPLLRSADNLVKTYSYYRHGEAGLRFEEMMAQLYTAEIGDVVLLQGSCHNPCGEDLSFAQWQQLTQLVLDKSILPLVDIAYHGLAKSLDEDATGWRHMAENVPEMLISYSGSKNFALYRDRVGALIAVSPTAETSHRVLTNMMTISRVLYSVPPAHGAYLVAEILEDPELRSLWMTELDQVRNRILGIRRDFADALKEGTGSDRFEFIRSQQGMFSFLGLRVEQVQAMRKSHSICLLDSSRINIAGLTSSNFRHVADGVCSVL